MKTLILTIVFSLTITSLFAQSVNCKTFKNGTFKMTAGGREFILKRDGSIQLEHIVGEKDTTSFKVNWVDDCTYTLTPGEDAFKKFPGMPKNTLLTTHIIKATDTSYTATTSANVSSKTFTVEIVKIGN